MNATQPVIYAGGGTISSNASKELIELNSYINFPVTNTLMGLGVYPATDEKFLGMLGMHGTFQANMAMHNADLILAIGARFDDRITNTPDKFAPNAQIVHFDVDHSSVSKIIEADIAVFGQVKNSLQAINSLAEVAGQTKVMSKKFYNYKQNFITKEFVNYALPLIGKKIINTKSII